MKKMKKSSVCLLLGAMLVGGSMTVHAKSYDFYKTLYLPIEYKEVVTQPRTSTDRNDAVITLVDSNLTTGYTNYVLRSELTGLDVTKETYISNYPGTNTWLEYVSSFRNSKTGVTMFAKAAGGNTGYYIDGIWNPNGTYN